MYTVYVLYSKKFDKIYIGFTSDLERRLKEHNTSIKGYTKKYRPWEIIYSEVFEDKTSAAAREQQLKTGAGRKFIWDQINKLSI